MSKLPCKLVILSAAHPDPVSVKSSGILSLISTDVKIKHSDRKQTNDKILQIMSVQGHYRLEYLLILSLPTS